MSEEEGERRAKRWRARRATQTGREVGTVDREELQ